jgi:GH15 family glucan-1,4-alpha-glucosidase
MIGSDPVTGTVVDPRFAYVLDDDQMAQGSTLGAPRCTVVIKATGAIEKVFSPDAGLDFFGSIGVAFWDSVSKVRLARHPGQFYVHPERQDHTYDLDNAMRVHEEIFAYCHEDEESASVPPPAVYYRIRIENRSSVAQKIDVCAFCELRGNTEKDVAAKYDTGLNAIVAWNESTPSHLRLFGSLQKPTSWETSDNRGRVVSRTWKGPLSGDAHSRGADPIGSLHHAIALEPAESKWIEYICVLSPISREDLEQSYNTCPDGEAASRQTNQYYWKYLKRSVLRTPDRDVNQGVLWAKANMLRVQTYRPTGWCFTNDPTRSNYSVGRDTAWMSFGADYLRPGFARESLSAYFRLQEPNGKIVEYYDVRNEKWEDYGLNVNDNTPLVVIALCHHFAVTGNEKYLRECYPGAVRAMDYMLSQRNENGLIWCASIGTADWGIVGWRNVIPNYRISGASTEVNSECFAALEGLAEVSKVLGEEKNARRFRREANKLRDAINTHLVNPENGLYYLAIDVDGTPRTDVTADLIFPVLCEVAPPERAARIIGALTDEAFWTDAGIRTIPRDDLSYGPTNGFGLLGGVWVAVTYWFSMAAAKYNPAFMARALSTTFRHFSRDPRRNNTVPGQFSEWLHGEILVNQGMMLSPWDAPRYLWAAIEGAGGLNVYGREPKIAPNLSADWRWLSAANVPFRGQYMAWIALRMPDGLHVHTTSDVACDGRVTRYEKDITPSACVADPLAALIAFSSHDRTLVFIGNAGTRAHTTAASLASLPLEEHTVRVFSTVYNEWQYLGKLKRREILDGIAVQIDAGGFAMIEITPP